MNRMDARFAYVGDYTILNKISHGTFAVVYRARSPENGSIVALKCLHACCQPKRFFMEIECLTRLGGKHHVVEFKDGLRNGIDLTLVLPYFEHADFKTYFYKMTPKELQSYMRALLESLAHVHSGGIIHRDIKPANFLHEPGTDGYCLVDFGLAQKVEDFTPANIELRQHLRTKQKRTSVHKSSEQGSSQKQRPGSRIAPQVPTKKRRRTLLFGSFDKGPNSPASPWSPASSGFGSTPTNSVQSYTPTTSPSVSKRTRQNSSTTYQQKHVDTKAKSSQKTTSKTEKKAKKRRRKSYFPQELPRVDRCGTRGFRAPEVLLKIKAQSTALDIWSAGIIMLCIMGRRYPFFQAPDDSTALSELTMIFGAENIARYAKRYGREASAFISHKSPKTRSFKFESLISRLFSTIDENDLILGKVRAPWNRHSYDLLRQLLRLDHKQRISAEDALKHPFFKDQSSNSSSSSRKNLSRA